MKYISFYLTTLLIINSCLAASPLKERILSNNFNIEEYTTLSPFPEVEFFDIDKNSHTLEEFEGSVILVNLWATWCNICSKELPELDQLQKKLRKKPIKIIALSQDFKGVGPVKEFYQAMQIKYLDIYLDEKNKIFNELHISGLPTSLVVDAEGQIVAKISGEVDWYNEEIEQLLLKHAQNATKNYNKKPAKPAEKTVTEPVKNDIKEQLAVPSKDEGESGFPENAVTSIE
jgi:thiol-disulfide isomerase/thioredoxin